MTWEDTGRSLAENFRLECNLGEAPIEDVGDLLARKGVDVIVMHAAQGEHGLTMYDPERGVTVIAVATMPWSARQRSTIAHELAHVLRGEHLLHHDRYGTRGPEEIVADTFARHLLLPLGAVRTISNESLDPAKRVDLAVRRFDVSPKLALLQMRQADLLSEAEFAALSVHSAKHFAVNYGWLDLYQRRCEAAGRPQAPRRLLERLREGYRRELIPLAELAAWNHLTADEMASVLADAEKQVDEPDDELSTS